MRAALAFALTFGVSSPVLAHGTSKSFAEWTIEGADAKLRVSFAAHDVFAAVVGLDADGDQKLSGQELAQGSAALGERTIKATELSSDGAACIGGPATVRGIGEPVEEIQIEATFRCPGIIRQLRLEAHYLPELEPAHLSVSTIIARDVTAQHVFAPVTPVFELVLAPPTFGERLQESFAAGLQVGLQPGALILGLVIGALSAAVDGLLALLAFVGLSLFGALVFGGGAGWSAWPVLGLAIGQSGFLASGKSMPRALRFGLAAASGLALGAGAGAGLIAGIPAALPGALLGAIAALTAKMLAPGRRGLGFGLLGAALLLLANKVLG